MARKQGPNSDPTIQGRFRNRRKLAETQRRADVSEVMALPGGRRFVYGLIFEQSGLMHICGNVDNQIYFHEGRRALGAEIAQDLQENHPEKYVLMINEQLAAQKIEKSLADAAALETTDDD